jgi:hypothetical protein
MLARSKHILVQHAEPRTPELFEAYDCWMSKHTKWLDAQSMGSLGAIDLELRNDHDDEDDEDDDDDLEETNDEEDDEEEDDGYSE